jgi:hypothetical protein
MSEGPFLAGWQETNVTVAMRFRLVYVVMFLFQVENRSQMARPRQALRPECGGCSRQLSCQRYAMRRPPITAPIQASSEVAAPRRATGGT